MTLHAFLLDRPAHSLALYAQTMLVSAWFTGTLCCIHAKYKQNHTTYGYGVGLGVGTRRYIYPIYIPVPTYCVLLVAVVVSALLNAAPCTHTPNIIRTDLVSKATSAQSRTK